MLRIISANLNGIRSASSKGFLDWLTQQEADFVCVQELKAQADDLSAAMRAPAGHAGHFHYAEKKGYSGVGIYTRHAPERVVEGLGIADIDAEGRYLQLDYPGLSVISLYLPSGSSSEERQQAKFSFMERFFPHLAALRAAGREVVICGDWNIAHREIDLKNWKSNQKNSGFLPEERAWLTRVLDEQDWVDVYRRLHPEATGESYTWWSNRGQAWAKNVGWRIDYHLATPGIATRAATAAVYKEQRFSDHAPLTVDYDWQVDGR
ncbi:exodeoxyribonuclease III [Pseudothauera rhizosphaerae]|uniref:Exodeoxyribonuclease III n=1 Tax=Pseudothauera rhizosphaerae TaxID=2565932 RepID=A0A4S4AM97_9RHOO|nr:exodeoxyribonuclease III [Pseudothauera rhizosphaerae]THF59421.1 exodeoxyribonuclease III [Pseudothauera rhizosphaerae]